MNALLHLVFIIKTYKDTNKKQTDKKKKVFVFLLTLNNSSIDLNIIIMCT